MRTEYLEQKVVHYFDYVKNVIVSNVSFGFGLNYEADLMVLSKSGYLTEVELKVSKSDLKADLKKRHFHNCKKVKYLCFAFPEDLLETALQFLPEEVGLLCLMKSTTRNEYTYIKCLRKPKARNNYKLTTDEENKLMRLGTMRVWKVKYNHFHDDYYYDYYFYRNQITLMEMISSVEKQKEIENEKDEEVLDWFK